MDMTALPKTPLKADSSNIRQHNRHLIEEVNIQQRAPDRFRQNNPPALQIDHSQALSNTNPQVVILNLHDWLDAIAIPTKPKNPGSFGFQHGITAWGIVDDDLPGTVDGVELGFGDVLEGHRDEQS